MASALTFTLPTNRDELIRKLLALPQTAQLLLLTSTPLSTSAREQGP